jgi:hypothetical protein
MAVSFATNIGPMFTNMDVAHMKNFGVLPDDKPPTPPASTPSRYLASLPSKAWPPTPPVRSPPGGWPWPPRTSSPPTRIDENANQHWP